MNKVLFVLLRDFSVGGSLTSMLNLLQNLPQDDVQIDVLMLEHTAVLYHDEAVNANLLPEDSILCSVYTSPKRLLKQKRYGELLARLLLISEKKLCGIPKALDKRYQRAAKKYTGYDCVIAFQEGLSSEVAQYIPAKKRIAWIHNDIDKIYSVNDSGIKKIRRIYNNFDTIIGVSSAVQNSLMKYLPEYAERYQVIYNTMDIDAIINKAEQQVEIPQLEGFTGNVFVSVGRFAPQKRFDRVPQIAKNLVDHGIDFKWMLVGGGEEFEKVRQSCIELGVENNIILCGSQANPYPYIKRADCMILTSQYEAHAMVANEGLILHKPVITTRYPSACEVIADKINGIICENETLAIAEAIKMIVEDEKLFAVLKKNADAFVYTNEKIIQQVRELCE